MAVYWIHHYFALPVIFENPAMEENVQHTVLSDGQTEQPSDQTSGMQAHKSAMKATFSNHSL